MKGIITILFAVLPLMLMSGVSSSFARIWHVPADAPTIQAGIDSATAGDVVEITCGLYQEHDIALQRGIIVRSETGTADCVTIDAEQAGRVFYLTGEQSVIPTVLEGLTIANGQDSDGAGLLAADGGHLVVTQCVFQDNHASGEFPIGGAIYFMGIDQIHVTETVFQGNQSDGEGAGGAIYQDNCGSAHFEDCLFKDNSANTGGAMVLTYTGETVVDRCVFWGNSGQSAAAVGGDLPLGPYTYNSCTFYANISDGGGVVGTGYGGAFFFNQTIFAFNVGQIKDGYDGYIELSCSDVYGTTEGDWGFGLWGQVDFRGNFSADPCFCAAQSGDFYLCADSWCLPGNHPWGCDELVGAFGEGCAACECSGSVASESLTWGRMKTLYK